MSLQTPFRLVNVTHAGGYGFIYSNNGVNNKKLQFIVHINGDYKRASLDSLQTLGLSENTWLHLAGIYDGKFIKLYLNGNLMDISPETGIIHYSYNNAMLFGVEAGAGIYPDPYLEYFLHGWMDEIRIWDYGRDSTAIRNDMYSILSGNEGGLIGYWNFDDGNVTDLSPSGNHGSLVGDAMIISDANIDVCFMPGDLNGDIELNVLDMVLIVNIILYGENGHLFNHCADLNEDGTINILDVVAILDIIIIG